MKIENLSIEELDQICAAKQCLIQIRWPTVRDQKQECMRLELRIGFDAGVQAAVEALRKERA